jgi:Sec-independent protein translocase protein TatA
MSLDPAKLLIVAAVALIVLGPEKLPSVLRQAGKYWSTFKSIRDSVQGEMTQVFTQVTSVGTSVTETIVDPLTQVRSTYSGVRAQVTESFFQRNPMETMDSNAVPKSSTVEAGVPVSSSRQSTPAVSDRQGNPRFLSPMERSTNGRSSHGDSISWVNFEDAGRGAFQSGSVELN